MYLDHRAWLGHLVESDRRATELDHQEAGWDHSVMVLGRRATELDRQEASWDHSVMVSGRRGMEWHCQMYPAYLYRRHTHQGSFGPQRDRLQ
jgi:hypothetical protein